MKGKPVIWLKNLTKKVGSSINRDVIVFAFFLFLSFVFWYLNSLGKEIEANLRYPVRYINLPKERVLIEDLPSRLNLFLKGPGYSILKLKLSGNRAPVILDISTISYRRVPGSSALSYYVVTSNLIKKLTNQLRAECEITAIKPDTLFFSFDRIITRSIPVTPNVEVITDRQYFVKGNILADPDSVKITGPSHLVDTVSTIRTIHKKLSGINKPVKKSFKLNIPSYFTVSEKKVSLTIPVEQFTEAEFIVPIKILNSPDSIEVKIFPDAVNVKCLVAISDYKIISEIPFQVVLDLHKVDLHSSEKIPLEILNIPPFVTSMKITPARVDFLIEKKTR